MVGRDKGKGMPRKGSHLGCGLAMSHKRAGVNPALVTISHGPSYSSPVRQDRNQSKLVCSPQKPPQALQFGPHAKSQQRPADFLDSIPEKAKGHPNGWPNLITMPRIMTDARRQFRLKPHWTILVLDFITIRGICCAKTGTIPRQHRCLHFELESVKRHQGDIT